MAQTANAKIVIVWDHQLIAAAKALHVAKLAEDAARKAGETKSEEVGKLWGDALEACYAAIYSPELASGVQVCVLSARRAVEEAQKS